MYGVDLDDAEEDSGAEEGGDEFVYQEEQDEQVVLVKKQAQAQVKTQEDEDFEKEFAKMMLDSSSQKARRNLDVSIPLDLQGDVTSSPKVVLEPFCPVNDAGLASPSRTMRTLRAHTNWGSQLSFLYGPGFAALRSSARQAVLYAPAASRTVMNPSEAPVLTLI